MQRLLSGKKTWLLLIALLIIFITISYYLASNQPKDYPNYVSESPSPTGLKGIYTYLEQEVESVERWSHSPDLLAGESGQLLLMVEPFFIPESVEMNQYIDFMKEGNTILLFQNNPHGMFDIKTMPVLQPEEDSIRIHSSDGSDYESTVLSTVSMEIEEHDQVLLQDEQSIIALQRPVGDGRLMVATSPNWLTNDKILEGDHTEIVVSLLEEAGQNASSILFDEYAHGSGNAQTFTTLYPTWMLVIAIQGIVIMILWLWYKGKRFGPVITPREDTVRLSKERLQAIAAWYLRGKRYQDSLNMQADYMKLALQEKWGIPYRKEWSEIEDSLIRRWNQDGRETKSFVEGLIHVLQNEKIGKEEYLLWSKRLEKLRKEVEES